MAKQTLKLAGERKQFTTFNWLTYAYNREANEIGFEEFIKICLGINPKDRNTLLVNGLPNDTDYVFDGIKKTDLDKWSEKDVEAIKKGKPLEVYSIRKLIEWAVAKDYLPEGNYIISVSW